MRVLLLAAGIGERLRPLTLARPKALMPVANRPVISRLLDLLEPYGLDEVYINLHAMPEDIKDVTGAGTWWNTKIHYSYEPELLGTAGAIKKIGKFLADDRFLLINTDIITDIDIAGAIEFHEERGSKATLVMTTPPEDPDYQQIGVSSDGRILIDKEPGEQIINGVYTGIGIFEPTVIEKIPSGYSSLLHSVLIPLAFEGALFAYFTDGYWSDIGRVERYLQTNIDVISGMARVPIDGRLVGDNIWIDETAEIDLSVQIEEPVLIGKRVSIDRNSKIGPNVIIGDGCVIGPLVEMTNSILWDKSKIGGSTSIESSIITCNHNIPPGQRIKRNILQDGVAEPMFNL